MQILSVSELMELYKNWTKEQCQQHLESFKSQLSREEDHIQQTRNDITACENLIKGFSN